MRRAHIHLSRRGRVGCALAAALVAAVVVGAASRGGRAGPPTLPPPAQAANVERVASFPEFALYALGNEFHGVPLQAIVRRDDAPRDGERIRANYVSFIYGDCHATAEQGCAPPLEVQVWPACERTISDYSLTPAGDPLPHEAAFVRGVPAAIFEDGLRLELYTGDVTVVVFGTDAAEVATAASALRGVNGLASQARLLPPPAPGALDGTRDCG